MGGIIDKITEFIKELLQGWVLTNFETMFTDVNDKVGTIAGEVSKTPSTWNSGIFDMIKTLSDNVMIPIAGMIISFVLVYELISMVIDKNNLHDFNTAIFIRFFMKACIAVMLLSKTFDIVMAVFDVGSHIVNSAAAAISGETSIDVSSTLQTMFNEQFSEMSIGELLGLGMETMIVSLCMKIMSVLITVILYGRMIEIYLYVSVAPVPCATVTNREWGTIGTNYFKGLCALAFQGFFMMSFQFAGQSTFTALGRSKQAVFFSLFRKVVIVIPLIYILPHIGNLGVNGVFMAEPVSNFIGGIACFTTMYFTVYRKLSTNIVKK